MATAPPLHLFLPMRLARPAFKASAPIRQLAPSTSSRQPSPPTNHALHTNSTHSAPLSKPAAKPTTTPRSKRLQQKKDVRIKLIRYHLHHPRMPPPLRFDRDRALRHWTIQRAWNLYRVKQNEERETRLARQFNKMREACEELRKLGDGGRLYRIAMERKGMASSGYPIELKTITDTPGRSGWNHEWKRDEA